jgi:predicted phosphodiesterase
MRVQLLSDLHLETEVFSPEPAPGAELLVLAGDIDATWQGYELFRGWPVPVVAVAGNHEFDGRDLDRGLSALRRRLEGLGIDLLEREERHLTGADGRRIRLLGSVRWCDFDLFGAAGRERAMRAAGYFLRLMRSSRRGVPVDAAALRDEALAAAGWLRESLGGAVDGFDATVVVTHFAPSVHSADPRFGRQPSTASFCNADDELLPRADVWLHGHVHCRHDYRRGATRVVCNSRGMADKGEPVGFDPRFTLDI